MPNKSNFRKAEVHCYSGYKANEKPVCFLLEGKKVDVKRIIDRWYGQEHDYFKVLGNDGLVYLLKWHREFDIWFVTNVDGRADMN
jgi:hypothetical protein